MLRDAALPSDDAWSALAAAATRDAEALADYPFLALLGVRPDRGATGEGSAAPSIELLEEVLAHWRDEVVLALSELPPGGPPAVVDIARRLRATLGALTELLDLAGRLAEADSLRRRAGEHAPAYAARYVLARRGDLPSRAVLH